MLTDRHAGIRVHHDDLVYHESFDNMVRLPLIIQVINTVFPSEQ